MKKIITSQNAPGAVGPYSQAVEVSGTLYVSGQLPINPQTGVMPNSAEEQAEQSLKNVQAIIDKAGFSLKDVVKTTVLLQNISDFDAVNAVYEKYFSEECPARACYQVAALPKGASVEIEAIAAK